MKRYWRGVGKILYFITWPAIWAALKLNPTRTRLWLVYDNQVLLVKDWLGTGKWKLPGGGLGRSEDPLQGAIRETKEEVGIELKANYLKMLVEFQNQSGGFDTKIIAYYVDLNKWFNQKPDVRINSVEIADYCWCDINDLDENKISFTTQRVLKHFRERS